MRKHSVRFVALTLCVAAPALWRCGPASPSCPNDLPASCPSDAAGWSATVEPLIEQRCWACHGSGQLTGHDLSSYPLVSAQRSAVLNQVYRCAMPPPDAGQLDGAQRKALLGWLVCGAQNN